MAAPATMNPLWIISLFLSVTQVCITTAAALTDGFVQSLFAVFAVVFATAVAFAFFVILWKKNHVLYAPKDYGTASSPAEFVKAMHESADGRLKAREEERTRRDSLSDEAAEKAVEEAVHDLHSSVDTATLKNFIVESMRDARRQSEIRVRLNGIDPSLTFPLVVTVDEDTTVQDFLNEVFFAIEDYVPIYSYGRAWVLQEIETGNLLTKGLESATRADGTQQDSRSLQDAGVHPGMHLAAVRVSPGREPRPDDRQRRGD